MLSFSCLKKNILHPVLARSTIDRSRRRIIVYSWCKRREKLTTLSDFTFYTLVAGATWSRRVCREVASKSSELHVISACASYFSKKKTYQLLLSIDLCSQAVAFNSIGLFKQESSTKVTGEYLLKQRLYKYL